MLKKTITKTETLKNNVKTINSKINEIIVRGGITSKSLAEKPKRIESMLGQYSKLAIIETDTKIDYYDFNTLVKLFKIPLNLEFEPTGIILKAIPIGIEGKATVFSRYNYNEESRVSFWSGHEDVFVWITSFSKKEIEIAVNSSNSSCVFKISEIIAIG